MKNWKPTKIEELSDDLKEVFQVLNEESDLACVLIGTSYLSELLANIIEMNFIDTNISGKLLNPQGGAIGQFSVRADLAYCLELLSKNDYQDLGLIASIRNLFAHKHLTLEFSDDNVSNICEKLKAWRILKRGDQKSLEQTRIPPRSKFSISVAIIGQRIQHMSRKIQQNIVGAHNISIERTHYKPCTSHAGR